MSGNIIMEASCAVWHTEAKKLIKPFSLHKGLLWELPRRRREMTFKTPSERLNELKKINDIKLTKGFPLKNNPNERLNEANENLPWSIFNEANEPHWSFVEST